jgi:hypothetical protein
MKTLIMTTILVILAIGLTGCIAISGHHHGYVSHEVIVAHPPDIVVWSAPAPHHHPGWPVPGPHHPGFRHPFP